MASNLESGSAYAGQNLQYANGIFFAGGYPGTSAIGPTAYFTVTKISYGISLDYTEMESRNAKTIYFQHRVFDNFELMLEFSDWGAYQDANAWFSQYCDDITDPTNPTIQPMGILVPDPFGFQGVGIPQSGLTGGDQVGELIYVLNIGFVGTTELADNGVAGGDSGAVRFTPGPQDILTAPNDISLDPALTSLASYYPYTTVVGTVGGPNAVGASADSILYSNSPPPAVLNVPTTISTSSSSNPLTPINPFAP